MVVLALTQSGDQSLYIYDVKTPEYEITLLRHVSSLDFQVNSWQVTSIDMTKGPSQDGHKVVFTDSSVGIKVVDIVNQNGTTVFRFDDYPISQNMTSSVNTNTEFLCVKVVPSLATDNSITILITTKQY